ncbi:hypothetical protein ONS96_007864 [Cadophora gregata f. sp. sojae]|nr:hypothetical protein ONS96_007864 [Cadophora gregata f. sp. sojae]
MATSFPSFPLLPKELRLTIWNLALVPRIVDLCFDALHEADENKNEKEDQDQKQPSDIEAGNEIAEQEEDLKIKQDSPWAARDDNGMKEDRDDQIDDKDKDKDKQNEEGSLDLTTEGDTVNDGADDTSETSEPAYFPPPLGPGQFYSSSPLPSLLRVNSEARSVALAASLKGFPVPSNQQDVYYNPEIDILFFPAGCWQEDIIGFEQVVSEKVKGSIRRIALENLMWMSYWEDGTINGQITIEKFKNLKEFIFAMRELTQCGCCVSFDGPDRGLVEFVDIDTASEAEEAEADADSEVEIDRVNDELRMKREGDALGLDVEDGQTPETKIRKDKKAGKFAYTKRYVDRLKDEFLKIKESHPDWNIPEARIVRLKRDGEFAGDP